MTAINLPGQLEVPLVVVHNCRFGKAEYPKGAKTIDQPRDVQIAILLRSYEERPTSETWSRIQALAAEILK